MKRTITISLLLGAFAALGSAQDDMAFQAWMKTTAKTMGSLKKNVEGGMSSETAADAQKLAAIYVQVADFFHQKGKEDAVGMAKATQDAAKALEAASADPDQAKAAFGKIGATCKSCHDAYREKSADGSYKMKL